MALSSNCKVNKITSNMEEKNCFCLCFYTFLVRKEDIGRKTERLKDNSPTEFHHMFYYCITCEKTGNI